MAVATENQVGGLSLVVATCWSPTIKPCTHALRGAGSSCRSKKEHLRTHRQRASPRKVHEREREREGYSSSEIAIKKVTAQESLLARAYCMERVLVSYVGVFPGTAVLVVSHFLDVASEEQTFKQQQLHSRHFRQMGVGAGHLVLPEDEAAAPPEGSQGLIRVLPGCLHGRTRSRQLDPSGRLRSTLVKSFLCLEGS